MINIDLNISTVQLINIASTLIIGHIKDHHMIILESSMINVDIFSKIFRLFWSYDIILTPQKRTFSTFEQFFADFHLFDHLKAIGGGLGVFFAFWAYMKVLRDTKLALFTVC